MSVKLLTLYLKIFCKTSSSFCKTSYTQNKKREGMFMKTLEEIKEIPGVKKFASYLAEDWQTVLIKAMDVLNRLERDGLVSTRHIVRPVAKLIVDGTAEVSVLNRAINDVQEILDEGQSRLVATKLAEVIVIFFAVKNKQKKEGGE